LNPNAEPIRFWNEVGVPKFQQFRHILIHGLGAHGAEALRRHPPKSGEHVLDIGCGWGDSSIEIARTVGESGAVLGIDCCAEFVKNGEAEARNLPQLRFIVDDAESFPFDPSYDLCFSRFGTMFFTNPVRAMRHFAAALKLGGRLMMVVWRRIDENECWSLPKKVALRHLPPPPSDGLTCGPGPFSMANPDTVREILTIAGYRELELQRVDLPIFLGTTVDEAIAFQLAIGPAGEIVREAKEEGVRKRDALISDLGRELAPYVEARGVVMPSSSWIVRARK
jgi:SAM-dependent methyltransferase